MTTWPKLFCLLVYIRRAHWSLYDTKFKPKRFLRVNFVFKETEFFNKPTFPSIYMLYGRTNFETHNTFWRKVTKIFSGLENTKTQSSFLITDEEASIVSAMTTNLHQTEMHRCWNYQMLIALCKGHRQWNFVEQNQSDHQARNFEEYVLKRRP